MLLVKIAFFVTFVRQFYNVTARVGYSLAADSTWIVDVQDKRGTHQCTGSLVNDINALTACSCVMSPDMKRKLPRRIVHSFKGEVQVRSSSNHFPHLWCEPIGKAGRPTYNYAITRMDRKFHSTNRLIYMPFFNIPSMTNWNTMMEYRIETFLKGGWKGCESLGWTYTETHGKVPTITRRPRIWNANASTTR